MTPVGLGLGPGDTIRTRLGNPFYLNLGSNHDAPFHEDCSRQLVGIHVHNAFSSTHRDYSCLLVIRYGDLVELTSKESWIEWEAWENLIIPIELNPNIREFGLLWSHILVVREGPKD